MRQMTPAECTKKRIALLLHGGAAARWALPAVWLFILPTSAHAHPIFAGGAAGQCCGRLEADSMPVM